MHRAARVAPAHGVLGAGCSPCSASPGVFGLPVAGQLYQVMTSLFSLTFTFEHGKTHGKNSNLPVFTSGYHFATFSLSPHNCMLLSHLKVSCRHHVTWLPENLRIYP